MKNEMEKLKPFLRGDLLLGLVGVGALGSRIKELALSMEIPPEKILLCDPARSREEAEEINDELHSEWGNGMGGCYFSSEKRETFLPLSSLVKADLISIQIPLTEENRGIFGKAFLNSLSPDAKIISFSPPEVFTEEAGRDPRVLFLS